MKLGTLGFSLGLSLVLSALSAPAGAQTSGDACYPLCRPGFLCHQGQCISACNPPCAPGQSCSASGVCTGDGGPVMQPAPPPPPPPSYPAETRPYPQQPLYPTPEPEIEKGREYFANAYVPQHEGFMLRLTFGFGGGWANFQVDNPADDEIELSSWGWAFSLDVGGSLMPNLNLHGRWASLGLIEPELEVNGDDLGALDRVSAVAQLLGAGMTYYVMPANVYFTGVIGFSWLSLRTCEEYYDEYYNDIYYDYACDATATDVGFGLNADIGKEWWLGKAWGLGLAGRFWYSYVEDDDTVDTKGEFLGFAVLFSATYQ
jgi:hypothetical protein